METASLSGCVGSEGAVDKPQWHTERCLCGWTLDYQRFGHGTDSQWVMVALLNQLKDLLLCPEPPRTPVEKPEHRGEAKGAGTSQHSYWEVLHSVTSCSHPGNHHSRSTGIAVPTQHHGGEEKEKEDTPLALVPHQRAHRGRRKGDGLKHHHQSFPLETRREGRREGGGLGHGELVNTLQLLWLWRCWAAERRGRCSYKCFIMYEPIGNRRGAFVPFTPEGMR